MTEWRDYARKQDERADRLADELAECRESHARSDERIGYLEDAGYDIGECIAIISPAMRRSMQKLDSFVHASYVGEAAAVTWTLIAGLAKALPQ